MTTINVWPLYICDDGNVIYYRDKDEEAKELDEAQRAALQQQQQQQQADSSRWVSPKCFSKDDGIWCCMLWCGMIWYGMVFHYNFKKTKLTQTLMHECLWLDTGCLSVYYTALESRYRMNCHKIDAIHARLSRSWPCKEERDRLIKWFSFCTVLFLHAAIFSFILNTQLVM